MNSITDKVKSFYEHNPFPNYDDADTPERLREKARQGFFAQMLDDQIPPDAKILEVGCGTGQLANFLALAHGREVWGTDLSNASLALAEKFKRDNGIDSVHFLQMDLFHPEFPDKSFDFVICNGVLHHTADPKLGFQTILKLLKPGGYVIIGLYNKYGRIWNDMKRFGYRIAGKTPSGSAKERAWFADQYQHPHETRHTYGEVLQWFNDMGVEFTSSIPKAEAFAVFTSDEKLFEQNPPGTWLDHFFAQLKMLLLPKEGGLFIMIGKKNP